MALQRYHLVCLKPQLPHLRDCSHILPIFLVALIFTSIHFCRPEHLTGVIHTPPPWTSTDKREQNADSIVFIKYPLLNTM